MHVDEDNVVSDHPGESVHEEGVHVGPALGHLPQVVLREHGGLVLVGTGPQPSLQVFDTGQSVNVTK